MFFVCLLVRYLCPPEQYKPSSVLLGFVSFFFFSFLCSFSLPMRGLAAAGASTEHQEARIQFHNSRISSVSFLLQPNGFSSGQWRSQHNGTSHRGLNYCGTQKHSPSTGEHQCEPLRFQVWYFLSFCRCVRLRLFVLK